MIAALKEIVAACKANGIRAALHCGTPEYAARADRVGLRHDDGVGRLPAPRQRGGRERRKVPATRRPDRRKGREGSILMPHLLIAGKLHSAGLALLDREDGRHFRLRGGGVGAELRALDRQGGRSGHPDAAVVGGNDRRRGASEDRFSSWRRLRFGGRRSAEQAPDSAVRRRRRELALGRRTRDDADPRLRKAGASAPTARARTGPWGWRNAP